MRRVVVIIADVGVGAALRDLRLAGLRRWSIEQIRS
jgi:hypothetical protein